LPDLSLSHSAAIIPNARNNQGIGFASRLESQASPYLGTNIDDYRRATPIDDGVWPPIAALSFNAYNLCTEIRQ